MLRLSKGTELRATTCNKSAQLKNSEKQHQNQVKHEKKVKKIHTRDDRKVNRVRAMRGFDNQQKTAKRRFATTISISGQIN
jgi:hypothetical protein